MAFPVVAYSFTGHTALFPIFSTLHRPNLRKMTSIIKVRSSAPPDGWHLARRRLSCVDSAAAAQRALTNDAPSCCRCSHAALDGYELCALRGGGCSRLHHIRSKVRAAVVDVPATALTCGRERSCVLHGLPTSSAPCRLCRRTSGNIVRNFGGRGVHGLRLALEWAVKMGYGKAHASICSQLQDEVQ